METLHPGLYFQEIQGAPPVEGASTSTAGFIGIAPQGRIGKPVFVTSWSQYVKEFGGFDNNSHLAYAVRGFFENGGSRAYVARAVHYEGGAGKEVKTSAVATVDYPSISPTITVEAKNDGVWGNKISFAIVEGSTAETITLQVYYGKNLMEVFEDVNMDTIEAFTKKSEFVKVIVKEFTLPVVTEKVKLAGGKDGIEGIVDEDYKYTLSLFDSTKINLLAIPGVTSTTTQKSLMDYCTSSGDVFGVMEVPLGMDIVEAQEYVTKTANLASEYAGIYYPHLKIVDPIGIEKNSTKMIPPSGHIMGIMARTDNSKGVWKAPAGTDAKVLGVIGLEREISDNEQDILNPNSINCIRAFEGEGICVWGARTLSKGEYKYLSVRRTMMFIKDSLDNNMLWTVFQPNDTPLWNNIKISAGGFLSNLWTQGGLVGQSAGEAFYVQCDEEINTPEVIDSGRCYVDIGVAISKPAEFIIFRLALKR